jgi:AraC family transcriptional regulator
MTAGSISNTPPRPYGDDVARNLGAESAPFVVTRPLPHAELAVTEINVARPFGGVNVPLPRQDAYLIAYHLKDLLGGEYWEEGRFVPPSSVSAGSVTIHDLRREPMMLVDRPLHTVQWFVPRSTLNILADEANAPYIDDLRHEPGVAVFDDAIGHMSMALLPALRAPEQASRLFADHMTMAFAAHAAEAYGGMRTPHRRSRGVLAPWQERQAKEMMLADLTGATSLATIAVACGLSGDHFARAFRKSTGLPPHAWLNRARVERAKTLLRERGKSLSEIALESGFFDQSHFTRVFAQRVGLAPGAWRRTVSS